MTWQSLRASLRSQPALTWLLPAPSQLRSISLLVAGNVVKLALGFVTSIVVFRALGPSDAGRLTLTLGILGLLSIIGEFGLRDAAVNYIARYLPDAYDQAAAVARSFLLSKLFLSALAGTTGLLLAGWIAARFYPGLDIADLIRLGAFSLFMDGLLAFTIVVLEAQQRFAPISLIGVAQTTLRAGLVLLLILSGHLNLYTLLVLESIVPLAVFIYTLRLLPRAFFILRFPLFEHLALLWHFTKWIALAALASTIFLRLDVLMLSYYRAPAEVGLYAAGLALVSKLDVVKNAILTTAFPDACRRSGVGELRGYVFRSLRLTALGSLAFLPLFVIGGWLIQWLYGVEYSGAMSVLYPLLLAFLIGLNVEPAAYVLYPLNQPRWIAASDLLQLVFNVIVNLALIPRFGMMGAATGVLLTRLLASCITFVLVRQFLWQDRSI
jgi:O-antigen/teichoic acid export membrane protein